MKRVFIVLANIIAALFMLLIALIFISQAFYNPITDLGGDYVYNEEVKDVVGPDIEVPPVSEVIYNSDEYFVIKQKPDNFEYSYYNYDWVYYYPYGRDTTYYWIIYKKEHLFVGPVLQDKYKAIVTDKDTDRFVGAFVKCGNLFQKDFIKQHGNDDYSIFKVKYIYLKEVRGDTSVMCGDICDRQGGVSYKYLNNIYYSTQDSAVVRIECEGNCIYERTHNATNNVEIDIEYVNLICKSFMNLGVNYIRINQDGTIDVILNECTGFSRLYRVKNDSIAKEFYWEKISGNWYAPK